MKKFFKYLGLFLLLIIAIVLIGGLIVPKQYHFEKSIEIAAGKDKVWTNTSTLSNMTKWMPWMKMDPKMTSQITGDDGNVGATYTWKSEDLGTGSMKINKLVPMEKTELDLQFGPSKDPAQATIVLSGDSTRTKVIWTLDNKFSYPMNFVMGLFMDKMMDKDYSAGLKSLKEMSEVK